MLRKILAVIAGVVAGGLVVFVLEGVGHHFYPSPPGIDMHDPAALKSLISTLPLGALLCVVAGWVLGAFAGGAVAGLISRSLTPALLTGTIQLLFGVLTMVMIPHPIWMILLGVLLPVPSAWLGARLTGATA
jgi:hypothetical protein